MQGFQAAAAYNNVLNNASGMQVGGLINKVDNFKGAQVAGLFNYDKTASGFVLAGLFNSTGDFKGGLQFAGLANVTKNARGIQFAGLYNQSAGDVGSQFAGLVNVAKKVKGFQFAGLVNIADSSDYPIGLVNFIKNGEKSIAVSADEDRFIHLDFRSGGKVLYGLIGVGHRFDKQASSNTIDLGFGAHIINPNLFSLNGEFITRVVTDFKSPAYQVASFKLLPGLNLSKNIRLFAGPSLNITSAEGGDNIPVHGWILSKHISNNGKLSLVNIDFTGGLQLVW